jgi:predicted signal transduction protein with EAL and GGDEF domain
MLRRPNHSELFSRDLRAAMHECEADGSLLALLIVQVGQLERVEGTLGYTASQALVDELCVRLRGALREQDQLIEVSDRKYWVIIRGVRNEGHALLAANKLNRVAAAPFPMGSQSVKLESAIGIALFPDHATEPEDLVRRGELALAQAHEERVPFQVYSVDSTREMANTWQIERELERALEDSELELYYQPKIDLTTFRPCGAEALIRWNHPVRGILAPGEFLPIAERAGKLDAITSFVLDAAQRQRCEWPETWGELPVSVNIPPSVIDAGRLLQHIRGSMRIWGSGTEHLILEVTEDSVFRNPEKSFAALARLRAEGIRVSIDDFGTGYSSMTHFKQMPADEIKIDRSFVRNLATDDGDQQIVRTIIDLAHSFGYQVVAEGVEQEAALRKLVEMQCDLAQGYLFSRPIPQREFMDWLSDYRVPAPAASGAARSSSPV